MKGLVYAQFNPQKTLTQVMADRVVLRALIIGAIFLAAFL